MKHFRFYEDAAKDDRVLSLPTDTLRWQWVALLCLAARHGGAIPSLQMAANALHLPATKTAIVIAALHRAGLLKQVPGGYFKPGAWQGGQPFASDLSTLRTLKFKRGLRERSGNAIQPEPGDSFRSIGDAAAAVVDRLDEQRSAVTEAEPT